MENNFENSGKKNEKRIFNLIIVDESGSMSCIHREALAGINETIETCISLQKMHPEIEQRISLITFDSFHFKYHIENESVLKARKLKNNEYCPSGSTPLYDAIGRGIAKLNMQTTLNDRVLVTIITDGEENCSVEYNLGMIKNLIEKQKKIGWTFTLIGTDNLDVENMAGSMAIDNHLAFTQSSEGTELMFKADRESRSRYCSFIAKDEQMPQGSYFDKE